MQCVGEATNLYMTAMQINNTIFAMQVKSTYGSEVLLWTMQLCYWLCV